MTYVDPDFSRAVVDWQRIHGRHTLPWQNTRDAYRIWLSEIMLQQTQVAAVIPYYERFLARFPDVRALAEASSDEVMAHWSGLGYYSRARNLHACARRVVSDHGGVFPADPTLLAELPGIGRSTAAAISAFAYGTRAAILDGNVKRVFARAFGIDRFPGLREVEKDLWLRAEALLPEEGEAMTAYTQGLMDLGATLCTRGKPACQRCPLAPCCAALAQGRVHELPVPKPKKATPLKTAVMLVLEHDGHVLLEKRPATGIWGGLFSLPELDGHRPAGDGISPEPDRGAVEALAGRFGRFDSARRLAGFSHAFTHFKLDVLPYHVNLSSRTPFAAEEDLVWQPAHDIATAPLPAPVKRLLAALFASR